MRKIIAQISTGLETEDKYRLLREPPKRHLKVPEQIEQGYFKFKEQEVLKLSDDEFLLWKDGKEVWKAKIPKWVKVLLARSKDREFRVRKSTINGRTTYFGAVKSDGRLTRKEWQVRLPKKLALLLWEHTEDNRIYKTRYTILQPQDRVIHLDVFEQLLVGLVIAEVECPDEESAKKYFEAGGPSKLLGTCVLVTYDRRHRHRKLMSAKQAPPFPVVFCADDRKALKI